MSIFGDIFSFVEDIVSSVLDVQKTVITKVMEEVEKPVKDMLTQVTNGIWKGKGADAFVNEINSKFLQATGQLTGQGNSFSKMINDAINVVKNADSNGSQTAGGLEDTFNF